MKKTTLFSALLGILAGFLLFPFGTISAQSDAGFGSSENACQRVNVILESIQNEDDGTTERVWKQCEGGEDGCKPKFCNATPTDGVWEMDQCNKYCVGFQESIPIGNKKIQSISGNSGTDLVMNYVSMIYKFGASILGVVAILIIVVSGVQMIAGGADENNYTAAKDRILQAILSLALLFSSALILRTVNPDFFT